MDRLREMEIFAAVAEAGGFAKAARGLGVSPPAATRAVAALEARLGARLLNRTTRRLSLTEAGGRFLERSRRLLADIDAAEREAAGEADAPVGRLTVTTSATFGRLALTPIMGGFLNAHPRVSASLVLVDRVVNLVEEGFDAAVRLGPLPDSSLVARSVGAVRRILVASPAYLDRVGAPERPEDLKDLTLIGFTGVVDRRDWPIHRNGAPAQITLAPRLEVNDADAALAAAEAGDGVVAAMSYLAGGRIRAGTLAPVLPEYWPSEIPVSIVYPQARLLAPKLRAFVDWTAPRLRDALPALTEGCASAAAP